MNHPIAETLVVAAACVAIVVGGLWIYKNVDYGCVNLFFTKACGAAISK